MEKGQGVDRSLWLPSFGALLISLIAPLEYLYMPPVLARSEILQDVGMILTMGGFYFFLLMTGNDGAGRNIPRRAGLELSRSGIQVSRPVRYLTFAGVLLFVLGTSVGYSSLIGMFLVFLMVIPGLVYRMISEDRKLREMA